MMFRSLLVPRARSAADLGTLAGNVVNVRGKSHAKRPAAGAKAMGRAKRNAAAWHGAAAVPSKSAV